MRNSVKLLEGHNRWILGGVCSGVFDLGSSVSDWKYA